MTGELDSLYQRVILDHHKRPRNFRAIPGGAAVEGHNPLCGDRLTIYLRLDGDRIDDVSFLGRGCAIATASASMMTELVMGGTLPEAQTLFARIHEQMTSPAGAPIEDLGPASALAGLRRFPLRVRCAALPWRALLEAAAHPGAVVASE